MSEWGVDVALTASQKAVGVPPGLALLVASPRAMEAFQERKTPVLNYYADWANWLPVMQAYEARKARLFWHAGGQPGLRAERQPGADPGRGAGAALCPPRCAQPRLQGRDCRAGTGAGAACSPSSPRTP